MLLINIQYTWEGISMNRLLNLLIILTLFLTVLQCSDNQNFQGRMSPEERAAQLKERLDLTQEQTKEVEIIYTEWREKMSEMRDQFDGDREQMREQMMASRDEINKKIEDILYEDQIELYREYQEERRNSRRERQGQRQRQ
jgi:hypothetical protein